MKDAQKKLVVYDTVGNTARHYDLAVSCSISNKVFDGSEIACPSTTYCEQYLSLVNLHVFSDDVQ